MADISEQEKIKLEDIIEELESIKGRHTELVSVLIPAGQNINVVQKQLEAEKSTANNIKSKQTRKAVIDAIDMIIRELKNYQSTPENGIAFYSGNVSTQEGATDIQMWKVEPPKPLKTRAYRCDQTFVVEPLKEMVQVQEIYGLLAIDRQAATIGILEGREIKVLQHLTSGVPGKVRAGGQCLSPDTLIMKSNGDIIEIKDSHNPLLIMSENLNTERVEYTPVVAKWENNKELYKILTCYPRFEIESSLEHTFFVRTGNGIEEKTLSEINEGDYLLMPEKIGLNLEEQALEFKPVIQQEWNMKKVNLPEKMTPEFAKIVGYYLGDGNHEIDRITFSEQREDVAKLYSKLIEECFGVKPNIRFREGKGYYQIRAGSRIVAQLFRHLFKERDKTLLEGIPSIILRSPDFVLASFISGFFDAEGYVSKGRVAAGFNNRNLSRQLQLALLRLGIISSLSEYDNRRNPYSNNIRYTVAIDDIESLKKFERLISFSSNEKKEKLVKLIKNRSNRNKVRQIVVNGKEVARIIRNSGLNTRQFRCPDFFNNKKQLSKELFKRNILDKISDEELKRRLELFYLSNLIAVKIDKIFPIGLRKTVDIETKSRNFIANGLLVHNSSQRFHRITEGLAKDFFRRVAEEMKNLLFDMPRLKGILVGGPIPTKEEFLEYGQLATKLKDKVIAVKDIGYVDEHGLELLVEDSWEDIAEQDLIKEKKVVESFFEILGKERDKAVYGEERVNLALERGAVDTLLISKNYDSDKMKDFEKKAENISARFVIVSLETTEGQQFNNITKGIGATLRFALE